MALAGRHGRGAERVDDKMRAARFVDAGTPAAGQTLPVLGPPPPHTRQAVVPGANDDHVWLLRPRSAGEKPAAKRRHPRCC